MKKSRMINQTIVLLFLVMICSPSAMGQQITTFIQPESSSVGPVEKVYEISPSSRDIGYELGVRQNELIQMPVLDTVNSLYISEITEDSVTIAKMSKDGSSIDPDRTNIILRLNETKIIKFVDSGKTKEEFVEFSLVSVGSGSARLYFKNLRPSKAWQQITQSFSILMSSSQRPRSRAQMSLWPASASSTSEMALPRYSSHTR